MLSLASSGVRSPLFVVGSGKYNIYWKQTSLHMIDCWWRRSVQRVKCCSTFVSVSCLCRSCRASVCPFSLSCRVASCSFISLCDTEKQQTTGLWLITWRAVDYSLEERFKFCPTLLISTTFNFLNSADKSYSRTEKKCQASISPRLRWYVFKLDYLVISPLCSEEEKMKPSATKHAMQTESKIWEK